MTLWFLAGADAGPAVALDPAQPPAPATAAASAPEGARPRLGDIADRVLPAVVHLKVTTLSGEATGTGFLVAPNVIATNQHVIDGARSVDAVFADGTTVLSRGLYATDKKRDLALIAADNAAVGALTLGSTVGVKQGDDVVIIGNPVGLLGTLSSGVVSAIREKGVEDERAEGVFKTKLLQVTAPISPGSSGSPAVGLDGKVIGVAVGHWTGGQNLNFIVPVEALSALVERSDLSKKPAAFGTGTSPLLINLGVSAAFFALVGVGFFALTRQRKARAKPAKPKTYVN